MVRESYKTEEEAEEAILNGRPEYYPVTLRPVRVMTGKWVVEWAKCEE